MKRILSISFGIVVVLAFAMLYTVWKASQEPVTHTPSAVETGRAQLHAQLEQAKKVEGQAEKQNWNAPAPLRAMVDGHKQRIEKLKDNKETAEILAYDRDAIERLEKRIVAIAQEEAAQAAAQKEAARQAAAAAPPP
jgi:DNA repair exonuclease SbcCD ATPase subunit